MNWMIPSKLSEDCFHSWVDFLIYCNQRQTNTKDTKLYLDNFNRMYKRLSNKEQSEYHLLVSRYIK